MDYQTARVLLVEQGMATAANPDALLNHLKQGKPPVPGLVTSILLALKVVFESVRDTNEFDRELACALYLLSIESRQAFEWGQQQGVDWPPLLNEDLDRISTGVKSIFVGHWLG